MFGLPIQNKNSAIIASLQVKLNKSYLKQKKKFLKVLNEISLSLF